MLNRRLVAPLFFLLIFLLNREADAALDITPLTDESNAQLVQWTKRLEGPGIQILDGSVKLLYRQSLSQLGTFQGGREAVNVSSEGKSIGLPEGLVFSTGRAVDAMAGTYYSTTKKSTDLTGNDAYSGDNPLLTLSGQSVHDLVLLEFTVIPKNTVLRIDYVFASEDYESLSGQPDRICTSAEDNDHFGFFISPVFDPLSLEKNMAVWASGTSIDAVSLHPAKSLLCVNKRGESYIGNKPGALSKYKTSFDGFSVPMVAQTEVLPGLPYKIRIAIADTGDALYDSALFVRFISSPGADQPANSYRYILGQGPLSTRTPVGTLLAQVSDPNGPVDQSVLDSGLLPAGITLDPFNGDIRVKSGLTSGDSDFYLRTYDYQGWHPCLSLDNNTANPCDYNYAADRSGTLQPLHFSFADANASTSSAFPDKLEASLTENVLFTVTLKDASGRALLSGGDKVSAQSSLGLINDQSGEVLVQDLGNGLYQFSLSSAASGSAEVKIRINDLPMTNNVKVTFTAGPALDSDNDGLSDAVERQLGTSPTNKDSDGDGIDDLSEVGSASRPKDSDGDKIIDALDSDDDNDGIPTKQEGRGDNDLDGIPNYLDTIFNPPNPDADSDGDGIKNGVENPEILSGQHIAFLDTDGDFLPNALDLDSDNDGKSDASEWANPLGAPPLSDKDMLPDYVDADDHGSDSFGGDSDRDTLSDSLECISPVPALCADSDADGQPDYMEIDSDNDGLSDKLEAGPDSRYPLDSDYDSLADFRDSDSDNDGIADAQECSTPPQCSDSNNNGIPDYRDVSARNLDGDSGSEGVVKTQTKGSGSFSLISLLVLVSVGLLRQPRLLLKILLPFFLLVVSITPAQAQSGYFYGGVGTGLSRLKPDVSASPSLTLDDDSAVTLSTHLGYGYSEYVSLELAWSDLGEATFQPTGVLAYEHLSFDVLAYYFFKDEARKEDSTGLYLSVGMATLMNTAKNINFDKDHSISAAYGLGIEHWLSDGWSVRFGFNAYDKDASELALSALYHFGADQ